MKLIPSTILHTGWRTLLASLFAGLLLTGQSLFALYDPATYNASHPAYPVSYTEAQKSAQRLSGTQMMTQLINAANSGALSYTITPGVYRLTGGTYALNDITDFAINCAGVEIWLEYNSGNGSLNWLRLNNCSNIKVLGPLTFDSEKLCFIQATVTGWNAAAGTIDVQVMPGYDANFTFVQNPPPGFNDGIFHYNQAGVNLSRPFLSSFSNTDPNDITKKRINVGTGYFNSGEGNQLQAGHMILFRNNVPGQRQPITQGGTTDLEMRDIACYYGPMWVEGWTYGKFININCSNYRRPGSNRLAGSEEQPNIDRTDELIYDGCNTGGGQDDGVNALRGIAWTFAQSGTRTIVTHFNPAMGETFTFNDGESWAPYGSAKVVSSAQVTDNGARTNYLNAGNAFQAGQGNAWRFGSNDPLWFVTFDRDLSIAPISMINRSGSRMKSIVIRNCYMADMNVGCVIAKSADRVLIENNLFERGRWETIVVGPSRYWWEGPICENITIRNNTINYPANKYGNTIGNTGKSAIIRVGLDGSTQKVINNVTITGNLIRGSTVNPITVTNSINVNVSNNTFITPEPENANYASYDEAIHSGIFLAGNGGALTVSGNTLTAPGVFSPYLVQFGPGNAPASLIGTDIPAAAPGSLRVTPVSATQFNLLWADNASNETGYIVERRNGGEGSAYTQIATLGANTTTYSDTSTHPTDGTNSYYRVRAVKGALLSAFTDSVAAHLAIPGGGGLTYDYYQGLWHNFQTIPDVSGMRPVLSGETSNFHLSMRERGEYYVVVFKGNIHIPTTGNYTFHTASDDLASLWIDGTVLVAPGPYGAWNQQQSGTRSLSAGQHSIQLTYFQGFGGGNLSVQWTGPGFGQQNIPNASLSRPTPAAATALTATVSGVSTINLAWTDNATNESGYVVERRTGPDGAWIQIASLGVNATSFSNTGVSPGTSYFYRVRALNGSGTSGTNLNGVASAVTTKASVMTWLKADAISGLANGSSLTSWSDTSGQGFHATQANAAQKPTYVTNTIGGFPAVRFNAAASNSLVLNRPVQDDFTLFCVYQSNQGVGAGTAFYQGAGLVSGEMFGGTNDFGVCLNADGKVVAGTGNPDISLASGNGFNDGRPHLVTFKRTRATGALTLYVDGVQIASGTAGTQTLTAPGTLLIGSHPVGGPFLTGDISEIKIFNGALADLDRQLEESALLNKYTIGLPSPWQSRDIGTVGATGSVLAANGVFTLRGAGDDIWNTADAFRFAFQSATADAEIVAYVVGVADTDPWAKGGVMIRENLNANSMFVLAAMRPDNSVQFVWRNGTGVAAQSTGVMGATTGGKWMRLTRSGNNFSAYYKLNAGDAWIQIGTTQGIGMATATQIGLALTSHQNPVLSEAPIGNVIVTP